jgi:hypothetical protein
MSNIGWKFKQATNPEGDSGGNPAEYALNSSSSDGLVHEPIQPSFDTGLPEVTRDE